MSTLYENRLQDNNKIYWLRQLTFREKLIFNTFLGSSQQGNIFQSFEWGELKKNWGWQPIRLILENKNKILGVATILKRTAAGMTIFYSPRGPVLDYDNEAHFLSLFCRGITPLAKQEKAVFWRVDPEITNTSTGKIFMKNKFKPVPINNPFGGIQPKWVWRIPLVNNPQDQWKMLSKSVRRNINKAFKSGIQVKEGTKENMHVFYQLLQATANRNNFLLRGAEYYQNLWQQFSSWQGFKLLVAYHRQEPVSTALAIGFGQGVWDIYAGNTQLGRDLGASYQLTWELIAWASEHGYAFYDLGGIAPGVDQSHPLAGLTMFKSQFGGGEVEFTGEFDLIFRPLAYRFWHWGQQSFQLSTSLRKAIKGRNLRTNT